MFPLLVVSICVSASYVWQTEQLRYAVNPCGVLLLWAFLRLQTPRGGMAVTSIRSTPGASKLLWFGGAAIALTAALGAVDVFVFAHPLHAPLELYHLFMFGPIFLLLFAGLGFTDRDAEATRDQDS